MKIRLLQTLIITIISFIFTPALAADRGIIPIEIKDRSGNQIGLYNESHALVIGVSDTLLMCTSSTCLVTCVCVCVCRVFLW